MNLWCLGSAFMTRRACSFNAVRIGEATPRAGKGKELEGVEDRVSKEKGERDSGAAGDVVDGRFVLEAMLGQGGMGAVWRARQLPLGRPVALKVLRPEFSALPHLRRRFAREARAAARLDHVNVVSVIDFGTEPGGAMYIAMELAEGPQLVEAIDEGLSVMQTLDVVMQLLAGLAHAHARGVVHRDLKPENVILAGARLPTSVGVPKIVDFGIATLTSERQDVRETEQDQVVGTPLYMSPEQASGERNLSPRTDLYNIGLILYELLSGMHPFQDENNLRVMAKHVHETPPPLVARTGLVVPESLVRVVFRALEKRPAQRFASAAEMRQALEPIFEMAQREPMMQRRPEGLGRAVAHLPTTQDRKQTVVLSGERRVAQALAGSPGVPAQPAMAQSLPFMGRAAERDHLLRMVEQTLITGRGRIVLVEGEAGVGKTRLAMWLKETLEERGLGRGHIGVFTRGVGGGLRGMLEIVESIFRTRGESRAEVMRRLQRKFEDWGETVSEADLGALLDFVRPVESRREDGPLGVSADRLFAALVRLLEIACQDQPRLLILDDVHWSGREFADLLDYLAVELRYRRMSLILVGTGRAEEIAQRPELAERLRGLSRHVGDTVERLVLGRMGEGEGAELAQALLPCEERLVQVVTERAAGNPLHLIMLMRSLSEEGLLEFVEGRWQARDLDAVRAAVPPSLADLFQVRLRQVDARYGADGRIERLLCRCAVLGKRFSYEVLRVMLALEGEEEALSRMDEDFDLLLKEGFITEVVGRGDEWYTFHHGLLRDMLVGEQLGPSVRRKLHRLAALALERVFAANAQAVATEIAQHWQAARELARAVEWFWRAGQTARRSFLQRHALSAYLTCVELMEQQLGLTGEDDQIDVYDVGRFEAAQVSRSRYLRAYTYAGDLYEGFGDFDQAERTYRRVVKLCGKPFEGMPVEVLVPLCQTWLGMGHIAWQRGDFQGAQWAFERVHNLLSAQKKAPDIAASALRGLARVAWHRGSYDEATALAERAYNLAERLDDPDGKAESLWIMGEVARMLADREGARAFYERSREIYTEAKQPLGIARNLLSMAQLARYHKEFGEARRLYEQALERYEQLGDRRGAGQCHNGLGEIARFEGRLDEARERYVRARTILESIGARYDVALVMVNLGLTELRRRDFAAAERHMQSALGLVEAKDFPYLVAGVEFNMALVKAMRGQDEEANALLRRVLALNEQVPISDLDFAEPLEKLGSLRAAEGSVEQARLLWERARQIYDELGLSNDLGRVTSYIKTLD
jgi:tetratricopeptide (TPR) repeat protein